MNLSIAKSVVDMREEPTHNSRVVSQALFAEKIKISTQQKDWIYITTPDGYQGWIQESAVVQPSEPYETDLSVSRLAAHVYTVQDTEFGPLLTLPYGTRLKSTDQSDSRWIEVLLPDGRTGYIQKGDVEPEEPIITMDGLITFSKRFMGLPYTWGGRSSFGYDCSGFVQMLYAKIGINLQRDSYQQILDDRLETTEWEVLKPGDLLFFGKSEKKIMHVALHIKDGTFIHTTARENKPYLRISHLTDLEWSGHPEVWYPYRTAKTLKDNCLMDYR